MTPSEAKMEFDKLKAEIGPSADVYVDLNIHGDTALSCGVYPEGIGNGSCVFRMKADDWPELLVRTRTKWAEYATTHKSRRIREMALKIIEITADMGECSDYSLRIAKFSAEEIARYGDEAAADADKITSGGPFKIKRRRGANAAA